MQKIVKHYKLKEVAYIKDRIHHSFPGAFLAGGAITSVFTNKPIKDFDIYFKTKEDFLASLETAYDSGWWCVAVTTRAITFLAKDSTVYQFMIFDWFPSADKIFKKFDYTCCMAALDLDIDELFTDTRFFADLSKRQLIFNHGTEFPLGSALRINKYKEKGFTIDNSEWLKVLLTCTFNMPKSWDELKNQLGGQYGEAVTLDTTQEFTLENIIKTLEEAFSIAPKALAYSIASNYDDAYNFIFEGKPLPVTTTITF